MIFRMEVFYYRAAITKEISSEKLENVKSERVVPLRRSKGEFGRSS